MKHILWLTPGFAAHENDSRCIPPLQMLAEGLLASGNYHLHIITYYPHRAKPYSWKGITVYSCAAKARQPKLLTWWQTIRQARRLIKTFPIGMIHSFWLNDTALMGEVLSRWLGLPHWVTLMGQDARRSNGYLRFFPLRNMRLVTLSPYHDDELYRSTGRRADRVIPWGVEEMEEKPQPAEVDLLGVGNLIPLKNYDLLVRLVAQLKVHLPAITAMLIGEGPERPRLEALAQSLGVQDQITFAGPMPREQVLATMRKSRVLVHPSTYESFGMVTLEALACGMAVVSAPVGIAAAHPEWRLAPTEPEMVAQVLHLLQTNPDRKPRFPYLMRQTIKGYEALYEKR